MGGALVRPPDGVEGAVVAVRPEVVPVVLVVTDGLETRADGFVFTVAAPLLCTSRETFAGFLMLPRVIPIPADPLSIVTRRGGTELTTGPRPTATTLLVRFGGGVTRAKRFGGFTTRGTVYQPAFHGPGCQNHP